jgi:prevent-host-death family protein
MKTITHRELRNRSGEVLRSVAQGETFQITNHGEVVARIVPVGDQPELRPLRPARVRPDWSNLPRRRVDECTGDVIDDLRGER